MCYPPDRKTKLGREKRKVAVTLAGCWNSIRFSSTQSSECSWLPPQMLARGSELAPPENLSLPENFENLGIDNSVDKASEALYQCLAVGLLTARNPHILYLQALKKYIVTKKIISLY